MSGCIVATGNSKMQLGNVSITHNGVKREQLVKKPEELKAANHFALTSSNVFFFNHDAYRSLFLAKVAHISVDRNSAWTNEWRENAHATYQILNQCNVDY
jgi:hypothetical protein